MLRALHCTVNLSYQSDCVFAAFPFQANARLEFFSDVRYMLSPVRLSSVCRLSSVTFVRPTQEVQIFCNISTALGTLAKLKISRRSSQGNPSAGGVKHKRGRQV